MVCEWDLLPSASHTRLPASLLEDAHPAGKRDAGLTLPPRSGPRQPGGPGGEERAELRRAFLSIRP